MGSADYNPAEMLSFVKEEKSGLNYWSVDASGLSYAQQCQLGKAMAMEAIEVVRKTKFTPLLGWIILDQCRGGGDRNKDRGVIVGFAAQLCVSAAY